MATKAVDTNMKNSVMISMVWLIALGAFLWMLPPDPIWIWSMVIEPKTSRKKIRPAIQKIGWRIW
ncbi:hypothetical protein [Phenylobacterium sp. J367]|uniref:hypothetical protein n=1 Tax=Phenylobacterium sp. J367 TaxID=2898435 RepID=UPI002150C4E2|nr:hypothetical protein [Phenylobacterium sp. J367]MCR5879210.1 hypothetical protein [Phenylobacterium sp. J367]